MGLLLHYVIIGNGGAGISALQTIREVDKESDVTIISREQYPAYSPCSLPNLIGGEIDKPVIFRFDKKFYSRLNVNFLKNTEALKIIPDKKEVDITAAEKFVNQFEDIAMDDFDFDILSSNFERLAKKEGQEVIYLNPLAKKEEFYFEKDVHWSPEGVELTADLLASYIEPENAEEGILEENLPSNPLIS